MNITQITSTQQMFTLVVFLCGVGVTVALIVYLIKNTTIKDNL